ncbi:hypothetical protein [Ruminococcus sp.]|uniref:hypothetical protein n=1 Tax=Ruminococcus sp. TaxID=41978 RepID=UPI0025E90457|nr:hypothetical protein [Ruminococcus sp.]MBQ8967725.1 hypothetical protein [Ruminococcus sp.]
MDKKILFYICPVMIQTALAGLALHLSAHGRKKAALPRNCFMLSAIFDYSGDLWLCVPANSLINTFSRGLSGGNFYAGLACKAVIIAVSVIICR